MAKPRARMAFFYLQAHLTNGETKPQEKRRKGFAQKHG
jgi:hypothetical protein